MESNCEMTTGRCRCRNGCGNCRHPDEEMSAIDMGSSIPLTSTRPGDSGRIVRVLGKSNVNRFLTDLGFVNGERISVVNKTSGNMILDIKGSRIAIDRMLASRIFLSPE
ncbi:MAG: FeoA family protein [Candidatus Methanomethylophilaceae archaeon]